METAELIKVIDILPLEKKFLIIEETLKSIKKQEFADQMTRAAEMLYTDYAHNKELTAFTSLDLDNFYEAK
jgi:hypothetical protein